MAKKTKSGAWYAILMVLLCVVILISCLGGVQGDDMTNRTLTIEDFPGRFGTFEGLDAQTEFQIMVDFFYGSAKLTHNWRGGDLGFPIEFFFDTWAISAYYGTFSGYIVVDIQGYYPPLRIGLGHSFADGYGFISQAPNYHTIAWKDGQVYSLLDLKDTLTLDEQRNIVRLHNYFHPTRWLRAN